MKIEGNCKRFLVLKINNTESPDYTRYQLKDAPFTNGPLTVKTRWIFKREIILCLNWMELLIKKFSMMTCKLMQKNKHYISRCVTISQNTTVM